jgi:hypothetical protein
VMELPNNPHAFLPAKALLDELPFALTFSYDSCSVKD